MPSPPQNPTAGIPAAWIAATTLLVDHAAEHHQRYVASLGVCDAQSTDEFALFAQLIEHACQRAAAAVNNGDAMAILRQLRNRPRALAQGSQRLPTLPHRF